MEKWLVGCGAAKRGVFRVLGHETPIAGAYYFRDRVRLACSALAHDIFALLYI